MKKKKKIKTIGDAILSGKTPFLKDFRRVISFETNAN